MRWITRSVVHPLAAASLAVPVGSLFAVACGPESTSSDPAEERPSDDELLAFFTEFCEQWEGCLGTPEEVQACAEVQIDAYGELPTACLNRVIVYHECGMALDCEKFLNSNDRTCTPLRSAIHDVDCGGMAAP